MKSKLSIKSTPSGDGVFIPFWIYNGSPIRLSRMGDGMHHVYVRFDKKTVAIKRTPTGRATILPRATWEKIPATLDTRQAMSDIVKALSQRRTGDEAHAMDKPAKGVRKDA